jgi:flagellar hook-associated protein 3 FlgL
MLRTLNSVSEGFVTNMDQIGKRMEHAQRQIATGLRLSTVSDAPDSISTLLQTRADLASTTQIQTNLGRVKVETDAGEQALQSSVGLVEQARVLGAKGVTGTATADLRTNLAEQVGSILQQVVALANTTIEGRYIFSGDGDQTAPYTIDLNATPSVSAYAGGPATREIQHPNGTRFSVSKTAEEIFDSTDPTKSVFASLQSLRTALQNNDEAGIAAVMPNIATSLNYLNNELAYYGSVQNKVANATSFGDNMKLQLQTHLSSLQDADLTEAILELNQAQLQQTAALQAQARMSQTSLFDYLK